VWVESSLVGALPQRKFCEFPTKNVGSYSFYCEQLLVGRNREREGGLIGAVWLAGLLVGRRTCDQQVASSISGRLLLD